MNTTFATGTAANRPKNQEFAGKAQMPEILRGVLTQFFYRGGQNVAYNRNVTCKIVGANYPV